MKFFLAGCALVGLFSTVAVGQTNTTMSVADQQALVSKYCTGCHNDRAKVGGFSWTTIDLADPGQNVHQTEKVIRKLRAGMMPPAGRPRPERVAINAFASALETAVDRSAAAHPFAGAPELHRLNRTEYRNAIHDLLAL